MLADVIAMGIPPGLQAEFDAGTVYRVGALLFRQGQRGIVAHITETQGLAPVAGMLMRANPAVGIANLGVTAVGQAITVAQNEQIKAALSTLQSLQLGSMVLSGVGIGVSIAGFAVLNQKISRVGDQVAALDDRLKRLEKIIDELRGELVAEDFDRLRTECERVDEGWHLADPEPQWRRAAEELHGLQNRFARRVRRIVAERGESSRSWRRSRSPPRPGCPVASPPETLQPRGRRPRTSPPSSMR